jgi:hypothetical protein
MQTLALLGALAVTGCAVVPTTTPPIAHPLATSALGWRVPQPTPNGFVIDTRAFRAARDSEAPGMSLNRNGKPRVALWVGVAVAGVIYLNALNEAVDEAFDCLFGVEGACDD